MERQDMAFLPFSVRAEGNIMPNSTTDEELEAIISSGEVDSFSTHLDILSLRNFLEALKKGTKVLAGHRQDGPVLGKSFDGELDEKKMLLYAKFYIQRGLPTPNVAYGTTDAYLASARRGTMDEISVGFYDYKQICDHDGLEMTPLFLDEKDLLRFKFCPNGHFAGQKIWVDAEGNETHPSDAPGEKLTEKKITATISDAKLGEFSIVTTASNPDAKVVERSFALWQDGKLEDKHINALECQYGEAFGMALRSKIEETGEEHNVAGAKRSVLLPKRTKNDGGSIVDEKKIEELEQNIQELTEQLNNAKTSEIEATRKQEEMEDQLKSLRDTNEQLVEENTGHVTELEELREQAKNSEYATAEYERFIEEERALALVELDRLNLPPAEYEDKKKKVMDSNSLRVIRSNRSIWQNEADTIYKGGARTAVSTPQLQMRPVPAGHPGQVTYVPLDPSQYE